MAIHYPFDDIRQLMSWNNDKLVINDFEVRSVTEFLMAKAKTDNNYVFILEDYIRRNPDAVNEKDSRDCTPLYLFTKKPKRYGPVLDVLMKGFTQINYKNNGGHTILGNIVTDSNRTTRPIFDKIMTLRPDPNQLFGYGNYPINYALTSSREWIRHMVIELAKLGVDRKNINADYIELYDEYTKDNIRIPDIVCEEICAYCLCEKATVMNMNDNCYHVITCADCFREMGKCHICGSSVTEGRNLAEVMLRKDDL